MSEMVERVATAIWALYRHTDCNEYDQLAPHAKHTADEMARAAIEAMREPTADMVDAGRDVGPDAPYGLSETIKRWEAMINAALDTPSQITPNQAGS